MSESRFHNMTKNLPVSIYVEDSDPDCFNGLDMSASLKARAETYPQMKKYYDEMDNKYQWTIVGAPGKAWAKKVFPELSVNEAYNKLWDRVKDPIPYNYFSKISAIRLQAKPSP